MPLSEAAARRLTLVSSTEPTPGRALAPNEFTTPAAVTAPFRRWGREDALRIVRAHVSDFYDNARMMYEGDHWQSGWGWIGPQPQDGEDGFDVLWEEISRGFVSRNVIREVVRRHASGVAARRAQYTVVARDAADARAAERGDDVDGGSTDDATPSPLETMIGEVADALGKWYKARGVQRKLRRFVGTLLHPCGRAAFRLFIPEGLTEPVATTDATGQRGIARGVRATTLEEALQRIFIEHPSPKMALRYADPDTQNEVGICVWRAKGAPGETEAGHEVVELSFRGSNGQTLVRTIRPDGSPASSTPMALELGGRLLLVEARRDPLVTWSLLQMQRALNLAETMIPRNVVTGGFLERILTNAQLPGHWEVDANGVKTGRYIPEEAPAFGPSRTNYVGGVVTHDEEGNASITTPGVHWREPVEITASAGAKNEHYADMLAEVDQDYILKAQEAQRSPEAARDAFLQSLYDTADSVNEAMGEVLETVLAMAEHAMGQPGKYTSKLRVTFACHVSAGPVTVAERDSLIRAYEKDIISKETAQEMIGVEDVDAENRRIDRQPGASIDLGVRLANMMKLIVDAGVGADVAAEVAGFPPAAVEKIRTSMKQKAEEQLALAKATAAARPAGAGAPGPSGRKPNGGAGRPSGTARPGPGQGQNKAARALVDKPKSQRPGSS